MSNQNEIPDWARELKTPVAVESTPSRAAESRSDSKRIEQARATAIDKLRQSATLGFGSLAGSSPRYIDAYFQSGPAGYASCWLAKHLYFLASVIETKIGGKPLPIGGDESYNGATGTFATLGGFSFDALLEAYKRRIEDLGLSEVLLEEWCVNPGDWRESNAFYSLSFSDQMDRFRVKA
jgi:hypothetical protein